MKRESRGTPGPRRKLWIGHRTLRRRAPGLYPDLGLRISPPATAYPDWRATARLYQRLVDRVREVPGIEQATAVSYLPLRDHRVFLTYDIEGFAGRDDQLPPTYLTKIVDGSYFKTLGIPLIDGRPLERRDADRGTDAVVVNTVLADSYWPGDAVGRRIRFEEDERWRTIVGVVGGVRDLQQPAAPIVYLPLVPPEGGYSFADRAMSLAVRGQRPERIAEAVRQAIWEVDPKLPISTSARRSGCCSMPRHPPVSPSPCSPRRPPRPRCSVRSACTASWPTPCGCAGARSASGARRRRAPGA